MSQTNYDVEKSISYNSEYDHYYVTYRIMVPGYMMDDQYYTHYECALSFDDGDETTYQWKGGNTGVWFGDITEQGIYKKAYFRNTHRGSVLFTANNCLIQALYKSRAPFEVQFNQSSYAAAGNPTFRCSTIPKNTNKQYEWLDTCTIYYKEGGSMPWPEWLHEYGDVTGTWSDYTITPREPLGFVSGRPYEVYIVAETFYNSDHDHSLLTAQTPTATFNSTDATAVAQCISPIGAFTEGDVTFIWSHTNEYGSPQYAYDLQYSLNNGSTWTSLVSHEVTTTMAYVTTLSDAGTVLWRVRTYNQNDVAGDWATATFVNNLPASPASNLAVNTKGRPAVTWASVSQAAYQVQVLSGGNIVYDSGAVYSPQTEHFINQYFNDEQAYTVRLRIYNSLGDVSEWAETGYQQPSVANVIFTVSDASDGGAIIELDDENDFDKYYLLRNNIPIAEITDGTYTDRYAAGQTQYSVVGVTEGDQSDIQTIGHRVKYDHATLVTLDGARIQVNKRVDNAYEIQTANEANMNSVPFIGDGLPTHYASGMRLKSFTVMCFDDQDFCEAQLGRVVFYADNFGNGGYCIVKSYNKTDNFIKNSQGIYANEVSLTLEVTNYDDSIRYTL